MCAPGLPNVVFPKLDSESKTQENAKKGLAALNNLATYGEVMQAQIAAATQAGNAAAAQQIQGMWGAAGLLKPEEDSGDARALF